MYGIAKHYKVRADLNAITPFAFVVAALFYRAGGVVAALFYRAGGE